MSDWLDKASERQRLAATLHGRHRRDKLKKENDDAKREKQAIDSAWITAVEQGKDSGSVNLCWIDLKHVGSRLYSFHQDHERELKELRLDGIGLSSLEDITVHCCELEKLSLASNSIRDIANIQNLSKLTQLNLLRNQLTELPTEIGDLTSLTRLELANNSLSELPSEISNLRGLNYFNLECNQLSELPISFGRLKCEVINLSNNKFTVCPPCLVDMLNLKQLSINYNEIGVLPGGLQKLKKLESLHASKNKITILPDSIVKISSLQCLWFDFNQLSSIPPNFHKLTRLKELKLEGNPELVYPPIRIVAEGTEAVMRWSRNRMEMGKSAKIRQIVHSLGEVLKQVQKYKIGGPLHESVFEVVGEQFQFPPDALWSIFLPELAKLWSDPEKSSNEGIKSFPYERTEVEQAIFQFRDAAGPIVMKTAHGRFRRCSCMQTRQSPVVCIPPKTGWMCTRPALLIRKECYEENMKEKRRERAEQKSIADAEREAKNRAMKFLSSDEGILTVRDEALERMALMESPRKSAINKVYKRLPVPSNIKQRSEAKAMLKQIEQEIRESFIREKINKSRNEVIDRNKRIGIVLSSWMGLSLFDAFEGWRYAVELANRERRREERRKLKEERIEFEDAVARYQYEVIDVSRWEEAWDEFNDVPVWIHATTKESQYQKPALPEFPPMPKSLLDPVTGLKLSANQIKDNEADSEFSYDSDSFCSDDSKGTSEIKDEDESARIDAPKGVDNEIELAKQRVLEKQRHHVRNKYNL